MQKAAFQFIILAAFFVAFFLGMMKIDWMKIFKVQRAVQSTEEKLGDLLWEFMEHTEQEVHAGSIRRSIDSLVHHLCEANNIDESRIKLHILRNDEINALTLPDRHLVIYTGLLTAAENQEEVTGIIGHEIAHMEKDHVMKKLVKEIGLSALVSMTTGSKGGVATREALKILSSSAYDRALEREADMTSVQYMLKADIDPEPFADFMYRMAEREKDIPGQAYWITTHPESKERAEAVLKAIDGKVLGNVQVISEEQWEKMKNRLEDL